MSTDPFSPIVAVKTSRQKLEARYAGRDGLVLPMVYWSHVLSLAFMGFGFCGWVWVQRRGAAHEDCEGLADEAACAVGPGCHGCARAADANDRQENLRPRDGLFPGERARPEQTWKE
jgi:hypothetical protein